MDDSTNIIFGTKLYSMNNIDIYTIENIKQFISTVKIWKGTTTSNNKFSLYNREMNIMKVNEIFDSILDNTLTPNIIQISEIYDRNDKKQNLRCWDGQHRWHAIRRFYTEKHNKDISHMFICFIYRNDNNDGALEKFINFNKMSPVPIPDINNVITDDYLKIKRIELVKELIDFIIETFPKMQSLANKPQRGNFNVNKLYHILYDYIEEYKLENKNILFLQQKIIDHNNKLKEYFTDKYKLIIKDCNIKKAFENNCYLFLLDDFTTGLGKLNNTSIEQEV
jgi:hypothetical protein